MKIRDGFILRQVAGKTVALATEGDVDLNKMITLNGTAAFLWEQMTTDTNEDALVAALLKEYDVDEMTARNSVQRFVGKLRDNGFLA